MAPDPRRVVVKIGTNTLRGSDGKPEPAFLAGIAAEIARQRAQGRQFLVVSSGAIGAGMALLGLRERPQDVRKRQALAAVGQPHLMAAWEQAFAPHGIRVGQLLLTQHSFTRRSSFLHLRNATEALLALGVVPVINENDTVSIAEIDAGFGDNDRLSAYVATKTKADLLLILSDVAGLFTKPPGEPGAELVPVVERLTPEVLRMAGTKAGSSAGRGGMGSKLEAARLATRAGIPVVIARGREPGVLSRVLEGEALGTRFLPAGKASLKQQWLALARPQGRVLVDAGAAAALRAGRHLLPAGVVGVEGSFAAGAVVDIVAEGKVLARAVASLGAEELRAARGRRSGELEKLLGRKGPFNVTRKGNLLLV